MPQSRSSRTAQSTLGRYRTLSEAGLRSAVLRAVDATFAREGAVLVAPFSIDLNAGQSATLLCAGETAAKIAARMAAGMVKPTSGTLLICDFDPCIQPVQAKRVTGYVPCNGDFGAAPERPQDRRQTIRLHAALFEVPAGEAEMRVASILTKLGSDDDFAFAVALALIRPVALLVCDRPPATAVAQLEALLEGTSALLSTSARSEEPSDKVLSAR